MHASRQTASLEAAVGCALTPLATGGQHHNVHYQGTLPDGTHIFVKVIEGRPDNYTAEISAAHHLRTTLVPTPALLAHGELDEHRRWLAYRWHNLASFHPTVAGIGQAGELLGALHSATASITDSGLRRYGSVHDLIENKVALVAEFDPPLADRIEQLHEAISRRGGTSLGEETCLLHGDVGWRNIHRDERERLWLIDFEHAAVGHPVLDFAKLWDRELAAPSARRAFLIGYQHHRPPDTLPAGSIDAVRLWAAAGIFPYARPRGDQEFERHAYRILDALA